MTPLNLPQWLQARHAAACLLLVMILALAACRSASTATGACPAPILGIITDENYQVIELYPAGAAAQAGVQIGDILISISPGPPLPPGEPTPTPFVCNDVIVRTRPFAFLDRLPAAQVETTASSAEGEATPSPPLSPLATVRPDMAAANQPSSALAEPNVDPIYVTPTPDVEREAAWQPYHACMAARAYEYSSTPCIEVNPGVLTSTVYFTEGQQIDWKISMSNPSNRILLKLQRGDHELEILVISTHIGWRRTTYAQETPTPVPTDYHFY